MKFLVQGTNGPVVDSPERAVQLLSKHVLPSLDMLAGWESSKGLAGGLPVGDRAVAFVVEAESVEALDVMLCGIPIWGLLDWTVTPLTSFASRAAHERKVLEKLG